MIRPEAQKALSILGVLGMIAGLLGLLAIHSLFSLHPLVILVQVAAVVLMVWARVTFGRRSFHFAANLTEGGLVTSGPYRYLWHPIYTAICLFVCAGLLAHGSWRAVLLGGLVLGGAAVRMGCEEKLVKARCPEYEEYAQRTWRMIPYVF